MVVLLFLNFAFSLTVRYKLTKMKTFIKAKLIKSDSSKRKQKKSRNLSIIIKNFNINFALPFPFISI